MSWLGYAAFMLSSWLENGMFAPETYLALSSLIHAAEETGITLPTPVTAGKIVIIGLPIVVLVHELTEWWMPKKVRIPIITWFRRRWVADSTNKGTDLMTFRNLTLFFGIAAIIHSAIPKSAPIDYLSDRLTSASARRNLDKEIFDRRTSVFAAGNEVMTAHAFDEAKASQLRDDALHRRQVQENRI
jgi:hypothetical protein